MTGLKLALLRYETYTSPAVVLFGIAMAVVFVVPLGLINAVTGIQVTMNVLAELIGGAISPGNALAMNYFKVRNPFVMPAMS